MTTVLLGLGGEFTANALRGLATHTNVAAVLRFQRQAPGGWKQLPVAPSGPLSTTANALRIPVVDVNGAKDIILRDLLKTYRTDVVVVACYPEKLPIGFIALASKGVFNIHPSLLPAFRGPTPLFWQLHAGLNITGVTVHRVIESFDTGNILAQRQIPMPTTWSATTIESYLAYLGGQLMGQQLAIGNNLTGEPQRPEHASYHAAPGPDAFIITQDWTVTRAYRFMRATAEWGKPYHLAIKKDRLSLGLAIAYLPGERIDKPMEKRGDTLAIQLLDGVLITTG